MNSSEHILFLQRRKKEKRIIRFFRVSIILVFILMWELFAKLEIINTFLYSSPSLVCKTLFDLFKSGELLRHIGITLIEVFISFFVASSLGIFISSIMWRFKICAKVLDPYLTVLNSLPKVALGPLIIIWVGASMKSIIFMALTISLFITIINVYNFFISTPNDYVILMKSFGANNFLIFIKLIIPWNILNIISALKVNISMSLIGVIMGELLVSKEGLGYLIMYGSQVFNINLVISSVIILGILSYLMYLIIDGIEIFISKKISG